MGDPQDLTAHVTPWRYDCPKGERGFRNSERGLCSSTATLAKKMEKTIMGFCFSWWQVVVRLSDWGSAMEHDEPGQVGNQAALSRSFLVPDSIPAGGFLC